MKGITMMMIRMAIIRIQKYKKRFRSSSCVVLDASEIIDGIIRENVPNTPNAETLRSFP
jgi:uncharacterized protein YacL